VLNRDYDWRGIHRLNPSKFAKVLNEVACRDFVSRMAYLAQGFIPPLGHAGFRGFRVSKSTRGTVHNISGDSRTCRNCRAIVHNVFNRNLGHSNLFDVARAQTVQYWLPFLWGIDCSGYSDFVSLCSKCYRAHESMDHSALRDEEERLRGREWDWADGSIRSFLKQHIKWRRTRLRLPPLKYRELEDRIDCALFFVWKSVHHSVEYAVSSGDLNDVSALEPLFPKTAAIRAAEAVLYD